MEPADREARADEQGRERPAHPALDRPAEDQREDEGHERDVPEQQQIESAGPPAEGHEDFRAPLLRHPRLPLEREAERVRLRHPGGEDDLADGDVPQRPGVVEPALAQGDEQEQPDEEEERRLGAEQASHAGKSPPTGMGHLTEQ